MNVTVYPLVWTINKRKHSFLGLTSDNERKEFVLPIRKNRYDRHDWGMFHWFEGYINNKDEFIIISIIEKDPPPINALHFKYSRKNDKEPISTEIGDSLRYQVNSFAELGNAILADLEKHQIDLLYIKQEMTPFSKELYKYTIHSYLKEPYTQEQIRTYCNLLSCTPYELDNRRSINSICYKSEIKVGAFNSDVNFMNIRPLPGEYRNITVYNISGIYIDELSKDQKFSELANIMKQLRSRQLFLFISYITLPQSIIDKIKNRIDALNPIKICTFEIEVLEPIDNEFIKKVYCCDYIIQLNTFKRIIYNEGKVYSKGFLNKPPLIHNLLEIIVKKWYIGDRELPPIPNNFAISDFVVSKMLRGYSFVELCKEHNIDTTKKIPCIKIKDWEIFCYCPVELYNGSDPAHKQSVHIEHYTNMINTLYMQLGNIAI